MAGTGTGFAITITINSRGNAPAGMRRLSRSTRGATRALGGLNTAFKEAAVQAALFAAAVGAPFVAAVAIGVKEAGALEKSMAFIGIKAQNLADSDLAHLQQRFLELSSTIPLTAVEFAQAGAVAAQMGISTTKGIESVAEAAATLSRVSDLSGKTAVEGLGRLIAQFDTTGESAQELESKAFALGSTLNLLAANTATTESKIVDATVRSAGMAAALGLAREEAATFTAAMLDMGVRTQVAGSTATKLFVAMTSKSAKFAAVTGQSLKLFQKSVREDAAGSVIQVVEALKQLRVAEKDGEVAMGTFAHTMQDLGLGGVRVQTGMAGLMNNTHKLTGLLSKARAEMKNTNRETSFLGKAFAKMNATLPEMFTAMTGSIKNFLGSIMSVAVVPVLKLIVFTITQIFAILNKLPLPFKIIIGLVVALAAGAAVLMAGLFMVVAVVSMAIIAFTTMSGVIAESAVMTAILAGTNAATAGSVLSLTAAQVAHTFQIRASSIAYLANLAFRKLGLALMLMENLGIIKSAAGKALVLGVTRAGTAAEIQSNMAKSASIAFRLRLIWATLMGTTTTAQDTAVTHFSSAATLANTRADFFAAVGKVKSALATIWSTVTKAAAIPVTMALAGATAAEAGTATWATVATLGLAGAVQILTTVMAANPFIAAAMAILLVVIAIVVLFKKVKVLRDIFSAVFGTIFSLISEIFTGIIGVIKAFVMPFIDAFKAIFSAIAGVFGLVDGKGKSTITVFGLLKAAVIAYLWPLFLLGKVLKVLAVVIGTILKVALFPFVMAFKLIAFVVKAFVTAVKQMLAPFIAVFVELKAAFMSIITAAQALWKRLGELFSTAGAGAVIFRTLVTIFKYVIGIVITLYSIALWPLLLAIAAVVAATKLLSWAFRAVGAVINAIIHPIDTLTGMVKSAWAWVFGSDDDRTANSLKKVKHEVKGVGEEAQKSKRKLYSSPLLGISTGVATTLPDLMRLAINIGDIGMMAQVAAAMNKKAMESTETAYDAAQRKAAQTSVAQGEAMTSPFQAVMDVVLGIGSSLSDLGRNKGVAAITSEVSTLNKELADGTAGLGDKIAGGSIKVGVEGGGVASKGTAAGYESNPIKGMMSSILDTFDARSEDNRIAANKDTTSDVLSPGNENLLQSPVARAMNAVVDAGSAALADLGNRLIVSPVTNEVSAPVTETNPVMMVRNALAKMLSMPQEDAPIKKLLDKLPRRKQDRRDVMLEDLSPKLRADMESIYNSKRTGENNRMRKTVRQAYDQITRNSAKAGRGTVPVLAPEAVTPESKQAQPVATPKPRTAQARTIPVPVNRSQTGGEAATRKSPKSSSGGGGKIQITIPVVMDGREITRVVHEVNLEEALRGGGGEARTGLGGFGAP